MSISFSEPLLRTSKKKTSGQTIKANLGSYGVIRTQSRGCRGQPSIPLLLVDMILGVPRIGRLVAVHGHPLRASAHFPIGCRADWPAAVSLCAALLQGEELLGAEGLVVDLRSGLNQILEMSPQEEVSEIHKFAVVLVLNIDDAPPVLAAADLLAVDNDGLFGSNDGEGNQTLCSPVSLGSGLIGRKLGVSTDLNLAVDSSLFVVKLIVVVGVHLEVVEGKLLLDALLERLSLLQRQGVGLGNHWNHIDDIRELLEDDNVDRLEGVARRLDEEKAAVDASILDVALALSSELLPQVGGMLVLDILDNGIPAAVVVDQVTVSGGIDNVQSEAHAVLLDDVRHGVNFSGRADDLLRLQPTLGLNEVGGEDGVDQGRLSQPSLACWVQMSVKPLLEIVARGTPRVNGEF